MSQGIFLLFILIFCPIAKAAQGASAPVSGPQMWSLPKEGPPTTEVRLQGVGFDPLTAIDVYFDNTVVVSTTTDKNGAFGNGVLTLTGPTLTRLQVPATALPGEHTVTAQERVGQSSAQLPFLVQTDWTQFQFSADHVGANPYENVLNTQNVADLTVRWNVPVKYYGINSSPVVANGMVYISEIGGLLHALDANTGAQVWQYSPGLYIDTMRMAVFNNILYVVNCDLQNVLCAFDASNGTLLWKFGLTFIAASPTVDNGVVYLGATDGNVYALNAGTGALLWKFHAGFEVEVAPTIADGIVYQGSDDGNMYALDAKTGGLVWKTAVSSSCIASAATVSNGTVYVSPCDYNTAIVALNANDGTVLWKSAVGPGYGSTPAFDNGTVYAVIGDGSIVALDAGTGALHWRYATGYVGTIGPAVAIADRVAYLAWEDGNLYALDAGNGALLWKYTLPPQNGFDCTPAIVNGMVYVGSASGQAAMYAFGLPSQPR